MNYRCVHICVTILCLGVPLQAQVAQARHSIVDTLQVPLRYDSAGGYRIAYYEAGPAEAPVVVLIPTLRWNAHAWSQNVPELSKTYRVIAIDPLGTGRSDKPVIDYKMDTWTASFAQFLRAKGIDRAAFVGTEMGGALAVQMALDYPQRVTGIVVAASNSGPGSHEGGERRVAGATLEATRAGLVQEFHDSTLITPFVVQTLLERRQQSGDRHTIQSHLADHRPPYSVEELGSLGVPAMFVWCRQDRITPPNWGRDFAAPMRRAEFVLLEGCGHYPNMERPEDFNNAVLRFLRQLYP